MATVVSYWFTAMVKRLPHLVLRIILEFEHVVDELGHSSHLALERLIVVLLLLEANSNELEHVFLLLSETTASSSTAIEHIPSMLPFLGAYVASLLVGTTATIR